MKPCYANVLGDCSQEMTREHFLSNAIQELIGDSPFIKVGGYPWCPPGQQVEIAKGAQSAHILCRKHNTELSPLDAEALLLFKFLANIVDFTRGKIGIEKINKAINIKGALFERWLLKFIVGALVSGNTVAGKLPANMEFVNENVVKILFGIEKFLEGLGFYVSSGEKLKTSMKSVGADFMVAEKNGKLLAVKVNFQGFPFIISFLENMKSEPELADHDLAHDLRYRPSRINFIKKGVVFEVIFDWPEGYRFGEEVNLIAD